MTRDLYPRNRRIASSRGFISKSASRLLVFRARKRLSRYLHLSTLSSFLLYSIHTKNYFVCAEYSCYQVKVRVSKYEAIRSEVRLWVCEWLVLGGATPPVATRLVRPPAKFLSSSPWPHSGFPHPAVFSCCIGLAVLSREYSGYLDLFYDYFGVGLIISGESMSFFFFFPMQWLLPTLD